MAIFLFQMSGFRKPEGPDIEGAVLDINSVFKSFSPDFVNLTAGDISKLKGAYQEIDKFLSVAKASGDLKKLEIAEHWLSQLNLPRGDSAAKLVFLESRLHEIGIKKTNASGIFSDLVQAGVNKLSEGAQKQKAANSYG